MRLAMIGTVVQDTNFTATHKYYMNMVYLSYDNAP